MDTDVKLQLTLKPLGRPWVRVAINGVDQTVAQLVEPVTLNLDFVGRESARLEVEHFGKSDTDPDTAVIIDSIEFFGIADPRFVWAGIYRPCYPDHYPDKVPERPGIGYLGWNGVYTLDFDIPVFAWIHRTLKMGWLYS